MTTLNNGATVIEQRGGFVLARFGNGPTPFVTWAKDDSGETYWGHYHGDLGAACRDLESRAGIAGLERCGTGGPRS